MMIKEHMEVLGADGVHVGTADKLEGRDHVKLTKDDPDAGGEHHFIPLAGGSRRFHRSSQAVRCGGEGPLEDPLSSIADVEHSAPAGPSGAVLMIGKSA